MMAIYDTMQFVSPDIAHALRRPGGAVVGHSSRGRHSGQADGAAALEDPHPPGLGGLLRPADGDRDPGERGNQPQAPNGGDHVQAHRADDREGDEGHGPGLLHDCQQRPKSTASSTRSSNIARSSASANGRSDGTTRAEMARATDGNEQLLCSFCGKSQRQVKKLIAGPGVYICDECIDLCNEIIDEELDRSRVSRPRVAAPPEGDLREPERLRRLPGRGEADARGRGLQPLQARPDGAGRTTTSSFRSRTSSCSARPAAARRTSRRRSRGSSTSRSRSRTRPR